MGRGLNCGFKVQGLNHGSDKDGETLGRPLPISGPPSLHLVRGKTEFMTPPQTFQVPPVCWGCCGHQACEPIPAFLELTVQGRRQLLNSYPNKYLITVVMSAVEERYNIMGL